MIYFLDKPVPVCDNNSLCDFGECISGLIILVFAMLFFVLTVANAVSSSRSP